MTRAVTRSLGSSPRGERSCPGRQQHRPAGRRADLVRDLPHGGMHSVLPKSHKAARRLEPDNEGSRWDPQPTVICRLRIAACGPWAPAPAPTPYERGGRCQPAVAHSSSRIAPFSVRLARLYRVAIALVTACRWLKVSPITETYRQLVPQPGRRAVRAHSLMSQRTHLRAHIDESTRPLARTALLT